MIPRLERSFEESSSKSLDATSMHAARSVSKLRALGLGADISLSTECRKCGNRGYYLRCVSSDWQLQHAFRTHMGRS